jgi:putative ABC transport system permease protein
VGGAAGLGGASALGALLRAAVPGLPLYPPTAYVVAALLVAFGTGLAAGVAPAHRAASLDPIVALRTE